MAHLRNHGGRSWHQVEQRKLLVGGVTHLSRCNTLPPQHRCSKGAPKLPPAVTVCTSLRFLYKNHIQSSGLTTDSHQRQLLSKPALQGSSLIMNRIVTLRHVDRNKGGTPHHFSWCLQQRSQMSPSDRSQRTVSSWLMQTPRHGCLAIVNYARAGYVEVVRNQVTSKRVEIAWVSVEPSAVVQDRHPRR